MSVIYIDGNCNLCNGVIKHIYKHRPEGFLFGRISPLNNPEYVIYIKNGDRYNAELALRMIVKDMGGYYSVLSWALNIVPKRLLDTCISLSLEIDTKSLEESLFVS